MKPVDQTMFGSLSGNCYPACLASILEIELGDVPNFCAQNWLARTEEWLRTEHDCTLLGFRPKGEGAFYCVPAMYHIIAGKSSRGLDHAVVGFQGKMVHDPHPSHDGLIAAEEFEFLIPLRTLLLKH